MIYFVFLYQIIEIKKNIEKCKRKITKIKKKQGGLYGKQRN